MLATIGGGSARGFGFGAGIASYWQSGVVTETIVRPSGSTSYYGISVDLNDDGTYAIVGAPLGGVGTAYIYSVSGTTFTQQAAIAGGSNSGSYQSGDLFGNAVAISGDGTVAVMGAPGYDISINTLNTGDAYVFERSGITWTQRARLGTTRLSADQDPNDNFGNAVDIDGDGTFIVVAAIYDDSTNTGGSPAPGAVYACGPYSGSSYSSAKITASDGADGDDFGYDCAISGNGSYIIVGAPTKFVSGTNGGVYIYERTGSTFSSNTETIINNPDLQGDYFGISVSINYDGTWAVVGAKFDDDVFTNSGAIWVFKRTGSTWSQQAKITADDAASSDYLGYDKSLKISDDGTKIIAATGTVGANEQTAYIFERVGETWKQTRKLKASDTQAGDNYGINGAISISGDGLTVLIGANGEDGGAGDPTSLRGCAYHYTK